MDFGGCLFYTLTGDILKIFLPYTSSSMLHKRNMLQKSQNLKFCEKQTKSVGQEICWAGTIPPSLAFTVSKKTGFTD